MASGGQLKILIVGADNLDRIAAGGQQRPYYILECGNQRSRSKPCLDNGTNPTWNTAHKFNITDEVAVLAVIKDEVTKGVIGQGMIELPRALQYGKDEGAAVLMNMGGDTAGTLRFKLKFSAAPAGSAPAASPPAVALAGRPSETGSHASAGRHSAASQQPDAAAAAAAGDDDPMLAAAASKVSLAKQAMQQLTAELAELTGADTAASAGGDGAASPFSSRQPPAHSSSLQERTSSRSSSSRAATLAQQYAHSRASARQLHASAAGSVSPVPAVSPSPSPRGLGQQQQQQQQPPPELAGWHQGWRSSTPVSPGGAVVSTDELLAMYGGRAAAEQPQESLRASGSSMLVRQLQEALAAAHAEKLSTEEELGSVKEAMAVMSKQHYLDVKRLKEAAAAASSAAVAAASAQQQQQQQLQQLQQHVHSPKGLRRMIDTHPPRRQPRTSQDSAGSLEHSAAAAAGRADKTRQSELDAGGELGDEVGSPVPAYKLQIQIHQLERQLAEQASKTQEEVAKREALAAKVADLQSQLEAQLAATRQAEANAKAAEAKAASQATLAAAARAETAAAREASGKEAELASELAAVRAELAAALAEKGELEEALGLMEKNNSGQVAALQAELRQAQEEAAALRAGNEDVAALQEQLAAARDEASGLRNSNEDVDYLQAQLRRTLRDNVELRHQVHMLQQNARQDDAADAQQDDDHTAICSEHEALMQELVATKLELAELKEQQVRMQRQLFKAQEGLRNNQI